MIQTAWERDDCPCLWCLASLSVARAKTAEMFFLDR